MRPRKVVVHEVQAHGVGEVLGLQTAELEAHSAAEAAVDRVTSLLKAIGIPSMRSLGATPEDIPALVRYALPNLGNPDNPVPLDADVFTAMFEEALAE